MGEERSTLLDTPRDRAKKVGCFRDVDQRQTKEWGKKKKTGMRTIRERDDPYTSHPS